MGYMTTITILNDAWHVIEKNQQQFIDNINAGMNGIDEFRGCGRYINDYSIGNHSSPVIVAQSNHADDPRLFLTCGNMMTTFGYVNDMTNMELRKELLKRAKGIIKQEERAIKEIEEKIKRGE